MVPFAEALKRSWPTLMEAVRMRRTVTYSELANRAGPPLRARAIHRQLLNLLAVRCRAAGLPDLCALVVRKDSGLPGGGWFGPDPTDARDPTTRWAEAVLACYDHRWPARPDPRLLVDSEPDRAHTANA